MKLPCKRSLTVAWMTLILPGWGMPLQAAQPDDDLLTGGATVAALSQSPAYLAALRGMDAAQALHLQQQIGPHEWTASLSAARRSQSRPTSERTSEWELGLERGVRLPGKAQAFDLWGQAQVELARAMAHKVWREQGRALLQGYGTWMHEREAARSWRLQAAVLSEHRDAVSRRHQLGDAARIDHQQADAAWLQADAQAQSAAGRAQAQKEALLRQFPELRIPFDAATLPQASALVQTDEGWLESVKRNAPELDVARAEATLAQVQVQVDALDTRPDPTWGVRLGQARSGAETVVGVALNMPIGGAYRHAVAEASAFRAASAALSLNEQERRINAQAAQLLHEARSAHAVSVRQLEAADRLAQAADSLFKGYKLGEGSLGDVLTARRLAHEQHLAAVLSQVHAWVLRSRLDLESDQLWSWPEP